MPAPNPRSGRVADDWVIAPLSEPERDFWEICEDRYQVRSTILSRDPGVALA
jgi:hypothetical protein